mgnify:CR=1 FL=1
MNHTLSLFDTYWSASLIEVNLLVFANLVGALLLGLLVGYERSYHGRAAGMRTYGIVCMASAALTVFAGYPGFWWGGAAGVGQVPVDPTRVVQGIVTGVGFLGAGVIMKEGMNISGLTTAASIWASSAIGVLVGVGFYAAAILLSLLSASLMMWGSRLEMRLPSRRALGVNLGALIAVYALAKLLEMGDEVVFHATGDTVSGHSLKHVAAALAVWPVWSALRQNPRAPGRTLASVAQ